MRETDADDPDVTLSDDVVTLRPWSRDDAGFIANATADPAIQRYSVPHDRRGHPTPPLSITDAQATIDEFAANWRAFATTGNHQVLPSQSRARRLAKWPACVVSMTGLQRTSRKSATGSRQAQRTRLRDASGDPPDALAVRARRRSRLLDDRRGQRDVGRGRPPCRVCV